MWYSVAPSLGLLEASAVGTLDVVLESGVRPICCMVKARDSSFGRVPTVCSVDFSNTQTRGFLKHSR